MYENIAWENFKKTGNIESFLEYKEILKTKEEMEYNFNIEGIQNESNKTYGDSYKGSDI